MSLSIRWRLAIWNALAFGALLAAFAALVYFLARRDAIRAVDRKLTGCLDQFARDERNVRDPVISSLSVETVGKALGSLALIGAISIGLSALALRRRLRIGG